MRKLSDVHDVDKPKRLFNYGFPKCATNKKEEVTERPSISYPRYITVDEPDGSQPERQPTADDERLVGGQVDGSDTTDLEFEDVIGNR